jgi:hypothetical protein
MIHDQADRDADSSQLLRYRDGLGDDWADIIDMLTMHPEARRKVARLFGRSRPSSHPRSDFSRHTRGASLTPASNLHGHRA